MPVVGVAHDVRLSATLEQHPRDLNRVGRRLKLALDLDPVRGHVMQQHRAVAERGPCPHELRARVEQRPEAVDLAPLDRVAGRLEAGVDRISGVRPSRGPVLVAVVPRDCFSRGLS